MCLKRSKFDFVINLSSIFCIFHNKKVSPQPMVCLLLFVLSSKICMFKGTCIPNDNLYGRKYMTVKLVIMIIFKQTWILDSCWSIHCNNSVSLMYCTVSNAACALPYICISPVNSRRCTHFHINGVIAVLHQAGDTEQSYLRLGTLSSLTSGWGHWAVLPQAGDTEQSYLKLGTLSSPSSGWEPARQLADT